MPLPVLVVGTEKEVGTGDAGEIFPQICRGIFIKISEMDLELPSVFPTPSALEHQDRPIEDVA